MKFLHIYIMVVLSLLFLPSIAQKKEVIQQIDQPSRQYHIGDTIPDVSLSNMINYSRKSAKLSDFKGKAIILDFWNQGCASCIKALPKMQVLQEEFKDDLQVLVISRHPIDAFKLLFKNSVNVKNSKLPMVFANKQLYTEMFPHRGDPYHVWIDKDLVVRAITRDHSATSQNIKDLIVGRQLNVGQYEDVNVEENTENFPRLLLNDGALAKYVLYFNKIQPPAESDILDTVRLGNSLIDLTRPYYSMLMKSLYHLGKGISSSSSDIVNPLTGKKIGGSIGGTLMTLYLDAYNVDYYTKVIIEDGGARYLTADSKDSSASTERFLREGHFRYESAYPGFKKYDEKWRNILRKDLERHFGYKGFLELRKLKCLVLFRTDAADKLATKGGAVVHGEDTASDKGYIINNASFGLAIRRFERFYEQKGEVAFIDETNIKSSKVVDMVIHARTDDIPGLNKDLGTYGLGVKEEYRMRPALVLKKAN